MEYRKRLLVITPRYPYPVIGGDRLRIYEICKELSKLYDLTLVSLCENQTEFASDIPSDGIFKAVHRVYLPKWKSYLNCLLSLPTSKPLQVAYYQSSKFKKLVGDLAKQHDMVLPHLIRTAEYAKNLNMKKVIEMTDAISMNYTRVSQVKNSSGIKGLIYCVEKNRLNRYEKNIAQYFDCNVFVSPFDRDFLYSDNKHLLEKSLVCSNGVDLSKLPYSFSPCGYKLVFIGNMHSAQNFDAAYWFAKMVMPSLRKHGPFEFHVIGKIPLDSKNKLTAIDGVVVTGAVESVVDHAHGALAGICSVRLAAGVQNKILEYMALGIPTITSPTGLEGLFAKEGESILVADSVEEYVNHILLLKNNANFAESLAKNAYHYVKEQHSWSGKLQPLVVRVNQLLK
ncbi:glycosyltransferase family 4 protein [Vibrio vulnificus]|uniref:glycosyltransferase family 4 protein n=1 Tax=Vibrio vulnificus TaxID=672 RepID=UPI00102A957D|nr:glycosyltransferase family 4 protein [Vibrio vulnificus]RZQ33481.1 glycosyltransferase [Vibrio vulnificus]RZQ83601.1 glycosyltransferase [Vibrio vulnificus]